jgi:rhodanese-related sulfurtransferase
MDVRRIRLTAILATMLVCLSPAMLGAQDAVMKAISPGQFKAMLDRHKDTGDLVVLDIRTPPEFAAGHIEGAVMLDYYSRDFVDRLKKLDRQQTYLIYCRSGNRTGKSLAILEKLGFSRVYHLETGLIGWMKKSYPLVRQSGS